MYCKVSIATWVPKSFCAAAVVCFLPLHIHGQKYIRAHAVSPFTPEPRVELFQFVLISVSRRSCNFLSFKTVLCHLMVSLSPLTRAFMGNIFTPVFLKAEEFLLVGVTCMNSTLIPLQEPSWDCCLLPTSVWEWMLPLGKQIQSISEGIHKGSNPVKGTNKKSFFFLMLCWLLRGGLCSSSKQTEDENSCERAGIKYV